MELLTCFSLKKTLNKESKGLKRNYSIDFGLALDKNSNNFVKWFHTFAWLTIGIYMSATLSSAVVIIKISVNSENCWGCSVLQYQMFSQDYILYI